MKNQLKTTNIQGKDYVEVFTRVQHFRSNPYYEGWGENSDIVSQDAKNITIKCIITNPEGRVMSTGHASEKADSSFINKTSHVENCETSALGRALGKLGIGIDGGFASYEEVANAKLNQSTTKEEPKSKEIILDIGDENWETVLNYIAKTKKTKSFEEIITNLQTKYTTIKGKPKVELKKAYDVSSTKTK